MVAGGLARCRARGPAARRGTGAAGLAGRQRGIAAGRPFRAERRPARRHQRAQRAARLHGAGGDLPVPPRAAAPGPAVPAAVAHRPWRTQRAVQSGRRRRAAGDGPGPGGAPRHPQDEGLRALPRGARPGRRLHCLVRAGPQHRRAGRAVLRAPLRWHALGHPHPRPQRALGWPGAGVRARRPPRRCAGRGCARIAVADLLRQHLQPGPVEHPDDAAGDAGAVLAAPAGSAAAARAGARRR